MPQPQPSININEFAQQAVAGQLDLNISAPGALLPAVVSPNQVGSLFCGQEVKLDAAVTTPGSVNVVAAAVTDAAPVAFGRIAYNVKASVFVAGDSVQIAIYGKVMWLNANSTIAAGDVVDDVASSSGVDVETHGTTGGSKQRGIALDPGVAGQLLRVLITNPVA